MDSSTHKILCVIDKQDEALQRVDDLLRISVAKFYVRSVGKRPNAALKAIIDEFQNNLIK